MGTLTLRIAPKIVQDKGTQAWPGKLENGREHLVQARVLLKDNEAQTTIDLDGKNIINWRGLPSALSPNAFSRPVAGQRCPQLATYWAAASFRSAELKMISGEAKLLRPPAADSASAQKP